MTDVLLEPDLPLPCFKKGKVREVYDLGDKLLIVASDRISAYDVVMSNGIPGKGKVLTGLSQYWFEKTCDIVENHVITADVNEYPGELAEHTETLRGCSMLVKKTEVIPVECVARGYLSGSGWMEYKNDGTVCGIQLPDGLVESDKLPETIYTPATKADTGHDINVSFEEAAEEIGEETAEKIRDYTLKIYDKCAAEALAKGIIIADTKFEFGVADDKIILIDEVLTPDSSRFWPADQYNPGGPQKSFDKQPLRDWLDSTGWDHSPPPPDLPDEVVADTSRRYIEAYEKITGKKF